MQAFKIYAKLMLNNMLGTVIMYICIFVGVAILTTNLSSPPEAEAFNSKATNVDVVNYDDSEISKNLESYITSQTTKVNVGDSEEEIKDAVLYGVAEYVLIIPEGFGDSFTTESPMSLKTYKYPGSSSGVYIDMLTNSYLSTAKLYYNGLGEFDFDKINAAVENTAQVEVLNKQNNSGYNPASFMNYLAYPLMALLLFVIPLAFNILNSREIKRRNLCSPVNPNHFNLALILCSVITTIVIFIIFMILGICLNKDIILSKNGLFLVINAFIFSLVCMSIGFFVANVVNSRNTITAISNVVSLGVAFTGGVFVPQSMMQESVLKGAVVNPGYWFVKANDIISPLGNVTLKNLKPAFECMAVELVFAIAFLSLALLAAKLKRQSE